MLHIARALSWKLVVVVLFFGSRNDVGAQTNDLSQLKLNELQLLINPLRAENLALKAQAEQREVVICNLQESLAVARTESELFRQKWMEMQLRVQTLGANPTDTEAEAVTALRQLAETVRQLYLAEAERRQMAVQLERLVTAVQSRRNVEAELDATKLLVSETKLTVRDQPKTREMTGALERAKILDVNPQLRVVVLNVGSQQGARIGMPFLVLRGDRVVAELRVIEVRPRVCGAQIERVEKRVTLQSEDMVEVTKSTDGMLR